MKRYDMVITQHADGPIRGAAMRDSEDGAFIRHDDPDLAALVAAARNAQAVLADHWFYDYPDDPGGGNNDDVIAADKALRTALAAVAGTTRGSDE